jgi:LPS export ABC transporter permease LptG/LPS export ABC transporter permease LptF
MRRLDRYIVSETIGPLALGFGVYTFIMLLRFLFRSADLVIRRGLSLGTVAELVGYNLPSIVVLTIPMALLFGIMIAIGRLASDAELVAMRAAGLSLFALYRPILLLSIALFGINVGLMTWALPRANTAYETKIIEITAQTAARHVEARVFYEDWPGVVLYVFDILPGRDDQWKGVFLAPSVPNPSDNVVTVAERGGLRVDENGERVQLLLTDSVTHKVDLEEPETYDLLRHDRQAVTLTDRFLSEQREKLTARPSRNVRSLSIAELVVWLDDPDRSPELRRLAKVEIHKKFSIPAACLVFGLFAVPLGFNNRRGGRSSGFALSIAVILVYYVLMSNGEDAARVGKIQPWLAMWLPNLLFTILGAFLLARRNRDKSLLLSRVDRWVRTRLAARMTRIRERRKELREERREARRDRKREAHVVVRLPRVTLRFPNLFDRYVLRLFFRVFLLVTLSGSILYIVADLTDQVDEILQYHVGTDVIVRYYLFLLLQIFFDIAPIFVLVTTLLTFTILARTNETTACKALGVSLFRLSVPALAAAGLVAVSCIYLQAEILPATNAEAARLRDQIRGITTARTYRVDRQWVFGREGDHIFNYLFFDPIRNRMKDLQVFEFDDEHRLRRRLYAEQAQWTDDQWILDRGWVRSFGARTGSFQRFESPRVSPYPEPPDYFVSDVRRPEQMTYRELDRYIQELERRGQRVPDLRVELQNKLAFPALSFIMALVALPFAFRIGKRGALYGLGMSLVLGMILIAVFAFFGTLGETGALPPTAAVWSPALIFSTLSMYLFLGVRT